MRVRGRQVRRVMDTTTQQTAGQRTNSSSGLTAVGRCGGAGAAPPLPALTLAPPQVMRRHGRRTGSSSHSPHSRNSNSNSSTAARLEIGAAPPSAPGS